MASFVVFLVTREQSVFAAVIFRVCNFKVVFGTDSNIRHSKCSEFCLKVTDTERNCE